MHFGGSFRLFRTTAPKLGGGELKIYKEKVQLYTKLKKNILTFKNVTMAKYLKAQERLQNRDSSLGYTAKIFSDSKFTTPYLPSESVSHLMLTTNRGTCGSINARQAQHVLGLVGSGYNPRVVVIGKKGLDAFPALAPQTIDSGIVYESDHSPVNADLAARLLLDSKATRYRILYTRFINVARQEWSVLTIPSFDMFVDRIRNSTQSGDLIFQSQANNTTSDVNNARLFAALNRMSDEALRDFYEFHVMMSVNYAAEENVVSEFAARIVAVENQLTNISKLRDWALSMYNKTRQGNITAELLELTSAAAAMAEIDVAEAARAEKDKKGGKKDEKGKRKLTVEEQIKEMCAAARKLADEESGSSGGGKGGSGSGSKSSSGGDSKGSTGGDSKGSASGAKEATSSAPPKDDKHDAPRPRAAAAQ